MILKGKFLALSHNQNNQVMKPIKTSGIILGITLTIEGLLVLVRPTLAISSIEQRQAISTNQKDAERFLNQGINKIERSDYQGNKQWIWLARNVKIREIVMVHVGDRSSEGVRKLWRLLPSLYRQCAVSYTDFWSAHKQVFLPSVTKPWGKKQVNYI